MDKFKSRKFWMAVVSALLVIANEGLGLNLDTEVVLAFAGIVMTYIFAEAKVDAERAKQESKE
jgi:uncharacterized membrane protein